MAEPHPIEHRRIKTNGIELHCAVAGAGPTVVLLHGFPEYWRSWDRQIPALAGSHRVVVPDLRGYGDSDKPRDGYDVESLCDDVRGIVEAFAGGDDDGGRVRVVGHDWGGAVAWAFAYRHADVLDRLSILNAPHPHGFIRRLFTTRQFFQSWYMFLFQLPWLPEWFLSRRDGRPISGTLLSAAARRDAFSREELDDFRRQMMQPEVLRCALQYYRTAFRRGPPATKPYRGTIERPVRVIWGEKDPALGTPLLDDLPRYAPDLQIHRIPESGHWVQREAADEVNRELAAFLA